MRLATYNVEWFANLFDDQNRLIDDDSWSSRYKVTKTQQISALCKVFRAIDADAVMIIEAPNSGKRQSGTDALEFFADRCGLRTSKAIIGFANDTHQEIALLYDPAKISVWHDPKGSPIPGAGDGVAPRFDSLFHLDVDIDGMPDKIEFSKPPLELGLLTDQGNELRLIGVHAKSKAPHGTRSPQEAVRISIANRRKQLAQCIWLRKRVEEHLAAGDNLIVLGDFNDGPGLDDYEKLFGHSGVEIVMGADNAPDQQLHEPHARAARSSSFAPLPTTSRFYNAGTRSFMNALLDYIMVSAGIFHNARPVWRIWHPFDDPECFADPVLSQALLTASDHFPVTVDLDI